MYTPHQSMHQFSPQRRQILGTSKRAGQRKAFLGDEEASSVGPQKLFSDLKNTSGKQVEGSTARTKSPSRALGVKNTQSPQRPQNAPAKSSLGGSRTDFGTSKLQQSPEKNGKHRLTEKTDANVGFTLTKEARPMHSSVLSPQRLEEGISYNTTTTPFPNAPRTPPAESDEGRVLNRQSSFVTPATNIGEAGAVRLRKGEILDAMNQVDQVQSEEHMSTLVDETEEGEEYPEIEYMPPRIDVPYDFPPQFDDLPKAKELGERMSKMALIGFYKPSTEEKRQEMLSDIFKLRPGRIEAPIMPPERAEEKDEMWSDVEVRVPLKSNKATSLMGKRAPSVKPGLTSNANTSRPLQNKGSASSSAAKMIHSTQNKKKALGVRDSNTTMKKTVMNPALRDFENDDMGKIIKAKLQALDSREPEGFLL